MIYEIKLHYLNKTGVRNGREILLSLTVNDDIKYTKILQSMDNMLSVLGIEDPKDSFGREFELVRVETYA